MKIGAPVREIIVEPLVAPVPTREPEPQEPEPQKPVHQPEPEKVPV